MSASASTEEAFLRFVGTKVEEGDRLQLRHVERLLRMAERLVAIEALLRADDPGHDVTAAVCRPTQDRTKAIFNFSRMGRAVLATVGPFESGVCRVCGCTRVTACDEPTSYGSRACSWIEGTGETLCSAPRCVAAGLAGGAVTPPPCFTPSNAIAAFLPPEVEPMRHRCETCGTVDGHEPGCAENEGPPVCDYCEGRTFYIAKDIATGAEREVSCLYCNETGRKQPDPIPGLSSGSIAR